MSEMPPNLTLLFLKGWCYDAEKSWEGRYLAFAKLNVNWSDPCVLYEYAPQAQSLTELARWDKADLVGLALP